MRLSDLAHSTAELFVTPCGALVSVEPVETIVALGPMIKLGCGAAVKALQALEGDELPEPQQALRNLSAVERDREVSVRLGEAVLSLWPEVPRTLLGELAAWSSEDNRALALNRRKRKSVDKASNIAPSVRRRLP